MVMRYFPVSSYIWVSSFCVCIVFLTVIISFSGLHSMVEIEVSGSLVGGGINLVSLVCARLKCVFTMFL